MAKSNGNKKRGRPAGGKSGKSRSNHWKKSPLERISNGSIMRLARRGGVKRISRTCYPATRGILYHFLDQILSDAICYTKHGRRKTVTTTDVVFALKRRGRTIYGF